MDEHKIHPEQQQWNSVDAKTIQDLSSTGRHQECLQACQQLLQSENENPLPWKYAGKSLLAIREFEKAQQCLIKAHQLDPKDPETTKDIGNISLNLGCTEEATKWYKKSLEINNNYAPAINNIADIKRQSGKNQEAVNLFKQAMKADPQLLQPYVGAAASTLALGDLDQAELFAARAIEINAHASGVNEILGITFQNKKNYQRAIESYQKELAINPNSNTSLINLGLLLLQQGKAAAAIEPLTRAAGNNPSEQCSLLLAQAYEKVDKLNEAIIEYKKIDITQSQNKWIPFNLGLCLLNTGSNVDAIEAFKRAIKLDESFVSAWVNIATALALEGRHEEAQKALQIALEVEPENYDALTNLGLIHKDHGSLEQALALTLKSLELKADNPDALLNLGMIYKDLGDIEKALLHTLKSLELNPDSSKALYSVGRIRMALGKTNQARKDLLAAIKINPQEYEAYYELSQIIETKKELFSLIEAIQAATTNRLTPLNKSYVGFALSNCLHKAGLHKEASKHLQIANQNKLTIFPSNADNICNLIASNLSHPEIEKSCPNHFSHGKHRIFIVGMPRSGSTLLETILSMNPEIKDLGESRSLQKAIAKIQQQEECPFDHQKLNRLYSRMEPLDTSEYKYSTDKQLYNFIYINWIGTYMPAAKIIHCCRNPMDNVLSMYRSNLTAGNCYTSNLEDAAKVLVAQAQAMEIQKKRYPEKIFTFDYDHFVNAPEITLRVLLEWLGLEFDQNYLHPEKNTRSVNTASVVQARKPINNKSVGGWKNYESLLRPALKIIEESGIRI